MFVPSTDGVQLAVHHLGGGGPLLLISHATGFHGHCYDPVAAALADRFDSVAFDYRGHGDTPRPDTPVDWYQYAEDALAMARWATHRQGGPVVGFGHSMGGACLLMAAHREPSLFRRLVVFEPIVFPPAELREGGPGSTVPDDNPMVVGARRRRATFPSYEAAIDNFASKPPLMMFRRDALEAYVRFGFAEDPEGVHLKCPPEVEAGTFATGSLHDTWSKLPEIVTDTVVVAGRMEPMQPSLFAQGIAERLPNSVYEAHEEWNHFAPMTHPDEFAALLARHLA